MWCGRSEQDTDRSESKAAGSVRFVYSFSHSGVTEGKYGRNVSDCPGLENMMTTEEKLQVLEQNGFETKHTLERFMGKTEIYLRFLGKFLADENMDGLRQAVTYRQVKNAFSYAHTLKGVAANLGIEVLLEKLLSVVEILRGGSFDGVEQWMPELEQRYEQVIQSIKQCEE